MPPVRRSPDSPPIASLTVPARRLRHTVVVVKRDQLEEGAVALAAVVLPVVLTAILLQLKTHSSQREYVFIYMAVVAVSAVLRGLLPAPPAAAGSFLLGGYFFLPP